jgi:hypothetical protein
MYDPKNNLLKEPVGDINELYSLLYLIEKIFLT